MPPFDETIRVAICAACLRRLPIDAATVRASTGGRRPRTVYASDELAFPGVRLDVEAECTCGRCVALGVPAAVAEHLARRVADR